MSERPAPSPESQKTAKVSVESLNDQQLASLKEVFDATRDSETPMADMRTMLSGNEESGFDFKTIYNLNNLELKAFAKSAEDIIENRQTEAKVRELSEIADAVKGKKTYADKRSALSEVVGFKDVYKMTNTEIDAFIADTKTELHSLTAEDDGAEGPTAKAETSSDSEDAASNKVEGLNKMTDESATSDAGNESIVEATTETPKDVNESVDVSGEDGTEAEESNESDSEESDTPKTKEVRAIDLSGIDLDEDEPATEETAKKKRVEAIDLSQFDLGEEESAEEAESDVDRDESKTEPIAEVEPSDAEEQEDKGILVDSRGRIPKLMKRIRDGFRSFKSDAYVAGGDKFLPGAMSILFFNTTERFSKEQARKDSENGETEEAVTLKDLRGKKSKRMLGGLAAGMTGLFSRRKNAEATGDDNSETQTTAESKKSQQERVKSYRRWGLGAVAVGLLVGSAVFASQVEGGPSRNETNTTQEDDDDQSEDGNRGGDDGENGNVGDRDQGQAERQRAALEEKAEEVLAEEIDIVSGEGMTQQFSETAEDIINRPLTTGEDGEAKQLYEELVKNVGVTNIFVDAGIYRMPNGDYGLNKPINGDNYTKEAQKFMKDFLLNLDR